MTKYELRAGNLILCGYCKKTSKVHEIKDRSGVRVLYHGEQNTAHDGIRNSLVSYEDCHGIPLTEEVFAKCGFIANNDTAFTVNINNKNQQDCQTFPSWRLESFIIIRHNGQYRLFTKAEDYFYSQIGRKVSSLHELQNCYYAITGLEIDISPILKIADKTQ